MAVGDIVWQAGTYKETVELESGNTRLVDCGGGGYIPVYRLEWRDYRGNAQNTAFHTWPEAEANFERRAEEEHVDWGYNKEPGVMPTCQKCGSVAVPNNFYGFWCPTCNTYPQF